MIGIFLKAFVIGYSGAVVPGSMLTYTIGKTIRHGSICGLLVSIGHALLELLTVILIFVGAGKYLANDTVRMVIGISGGLVLIYMAVGMLRNNDFEAIQLTEDDNGAKESRLINVVLGGAVVSAVNPYFTIWWSMVGFTLIMSAYNAFGLAGIVVFYLGHILADISWYVFIAVLVSKTRKFLSPKKYKLIMAGLGVCLMVFGLSFIWSAFPLIHKMYW